MPEDPAALRRPRKPLFFSGPHGDCINCREAEARYWAGENIGPLCVSCAEHLRNAIEAAGSLVPQGKDYEKLYHELLYAVGMKHPGETRHETALRYIRRAEEGTGVAMANLNPPLLPGTAVPQEKEKK